LAIYKRYQVLGKNVSQQFLKSPGYKKKATKFYSKGKFQF